MLRAAVHSTVKKINTMSGSSHLDLNLTLGSDFWPLPPCLNLTRMNSDITETYTQQPASASPEAIPPPPSLASLPSSAPQCETSARPQRAAKRRAVENIRNIQEWERCPESSDLFRRVERRFNEELNNEILTREEREQVEPGEIPDSSEAVDTEREEPWTEISDDESPTASLRDFIVTDDEDVPDDDSFHACSEADTGDGSEAGSEEDTTSEEGETNAEEDASEGDETQEY